MQIGYKVPPFNLYLTSGTIYLLSAHTLKLWLEVLIKRLYTDEIEVIVLVHSLQVEVLCYIYSQTEMKK